MAEKNVSTLKEEFETALNQSNSKDRAVKIYQAFRDAQRCVGALMYDYERAIEWIRINEGDYEYNYQGSQDNFYYNEKEERKKKIISVQEEVFTFVQKAIGVLEKDKKAVDLEVKSFKVADGILVNEQLSAFDRSKVTNAFVSIQNTKDLICEVLDVLQVSPYAVAISKDKEAKTGLNISGDEPKA
ncbi:MAG: hypothetical protein IKC11_03770 [Clostridia bacterium]|nr:hypothetical protein [Clostridia bacterium]